MGCAIIPYKDYGAVDNEEQMVEELYDLAGTYVMRIDTEVRADILSAVLERDSADCGESFSGCGVFDDRGLSAQTPCRMTHGGHLKPSLILENQGCAESGDFFLMRCHSSFIQRCISFSSRSAALLFGFCQDNPS